MTTLAYGLQPPAFRLPDSTHLGRVRLQVTDFPRSLAFYISVLGFRVVAQRAGIVELGAHGDDRVILELQSVRDMLRGEGERVSREIAGYASLSHAAMTAMKVIGDSLTQWKSAPDRAGQRSAG